MSHIKQPLRVTLLGMLLLFSATYASATGVLTPAATAPSLKVQDIDGSPSVNVNALKFTNGTVTDNADGTATVTISGAGSVTSVDAANGVETVSGSPITATGTIRGAELVNAQTGTTYTYLTGDRGKLLTHTNAAAIAGTLPQASASFPSGWYMDVQNRGAGTLTITPTTSTIDGAASLALTQNQGVRIVSDGTNYYSMRGIGSSSGAPSTATYITQTADGGLSAEQALGTLATGCMASTTTSGVVATRTITGTANQITVTNGDCSAAPTISIPTNPTLPGNVSVTGTLTVGSGAGPALFDMLEGTAPGANATASHHNVYMNSTGSVLESHEQGGTVKTYLYSGGALGTPASGTLTNATGLPISTGVSGLGTGVATSLAVANNSAGGYSPIDGTATLTNKTIDAEGTGNVLTVPRRIWLPAAGCNNATAGSIWDLPAASFAVAACITGTNTQKGVLDFADAASLSAQITYKLPSTWSGTVDANIKWLSASTNAQDVVWQIATVCVADAETDDPAFNTASTVTDANKITLNQTNDAAITSVTVTGCAAGELMHIKILRDSAHASDTLTATARLIGVELVIREAI